MPTNLDFTKNLVQHPDIEALNYHTRFAETWLDELLVERRHPERFFPDPGLSHSQAGAAVDSSDPLAVLNYGKQTQQGTTVETERPGESTLYSPMQGTVL